MISQALAKLVERQDLSLSEAEHVMNQIMRGQATPAQIGAFLTALRLKGETVDEIAGCAVAMRSHAATVQARRQPLIDVCGTGGDGKGTFNISTTVSFVIAGAGLAVAKHGNRSVSSRCGSADLLEALGVNLDLSGEEVAACIDEVGLGFLFAPALHPAMRYAIGPRRELGIRTVFNLLGPLCNPARATVQLIGVYSESLVEPIANVLAALGTRSAFVVHGADGLDELSTTGSNRVAAVHGTEVSHLRLHPHDVGLPLASVDALRGGGPDENAAITLDILSGKQGPRRDIVLLNSAAALLAGGVAGTFAEGLEMAAYSVDSGRARAKLDQLIERTRQARRLPDNVTLAEGRNA